MQNRASFNPLSGALFCRKISKDIIKEKQDEAN